MCVRVCVEKKNDKSCYVQSVVLQQATSNVECERVRKKIKSAVAVDDE